MAEYKQLCVELLSELENAIRVVHLVSDGTRHLPAYPVINKVKNALAEPEPEREGSTDDELNEPLGDLIDKWCQEGMRVKPHGTSFPLAHYVASKAYQYGLRKGRPAPVPVSERLPGTEDCDRWERVWCWNLRGQSTWVLSRIDLGIHSHWLPAHVLLVPSYD